MTPYPANRVKPGDTIIVMIGKPAGVVTERFQQTGQHGESMYITVDHNGEKTEYVVGCDHTVWRVE